MRQAGVEPIALMESVSVMGVAEVLQHLPAIQETKRAIQAALKMGVDAAIFIDAPDLHLPLAKQAKRLGAISIGYVSPQVWAWRPSRAKTVTSAFDKLLCLFDFEPQLFPNLDAQWVGHPVIDRQHPRQHCDPNLFGLTPGSRKQETDRMLKPFIEAAAHIRRIRPAAKFKLVSPVQGLDLPTWIEQSDRIDHLATARGVLTKSGTITLELAVMGIPQVVAHRVHPLTYWLGRHLVEGIRHIAMPNILSNTSVVPEFIQNFTPEQLGNQVLDLPQHQPVDLEALGAPGAVARAAEAVWTRVEAA